MKGVKGKQITVHALYTHIIITVLSTSVTAKALNSSHNRTQDWQMGQVQRKSNTYTNYFSEGQYTNYFDSWRNPVARLHFMLCFVSLFTIVASPLLPW